MDIYNKEIYQMDSNMSILEIMSLASIIQGEAMIVEEMPIISSVYHNRLKKKMKLEADPTVLYFMNLEDLENFKKHSGTKNLQEFLKKYKKMKNPYNTYLNYGLPSGPINNPGLEAIKSAINPAQTEKKYYYFVADGSGGHIFTTTLKEHKRAIRKIEMDIKSLNDRQKNAVLTIGGPMLVFAGAGSGKTRVLTYKIAYLIQEIGMLPENILAVTFTNKAAQEMKSRVHDLVDVDLSGITIGTFHSIGAMILRREIGRLGWDSNFTIYDQTDSKSLVKNIIKDLNLDLKMYDPKSTLIKISIAKNSMQSFETLIRSSKNIHEEKIAQIYKEYEQSLKGNNCLDFDDLLVKPLDLFNQFQKF